jgi:GntR family transcriptional regulator, transcriptional repressor for pyruvate dehydrogenase complex
MPQTTGTPKASIAGDVARAAISASGPFSLVAQLRTNEPAGTDRAEQIVHQLETAIAVGLIGYGERLPPERELAAQLGVAVLTLRTALASLRDRGFIETRRGRGGGSAVCDAGVVTENERRRRLREHSTEELRDSGDLSGGIAAAAARLAAARSDDSDQLRLRNLAENFSAALTPLDRRRADSRFHIGIAVAAQSKRLTTATVQVRGEIAPLLWASDPAAQLFAWDQAAQDHAAIVAAIVAGDEAVAQAAALEHCARETEAVINAHLELVMTETGF